VSPLIRPKFTSIDGLSIRYAESAHGRQEDARLLSPWPESVFAFEQVWARLAEHGHLIAVDPPGFGQSEHRDDLMSPKAMGEFIIRLADSSGLDNPHVVAPDIGTSSTLFAAADIPAGSVVRSSAAAEPRCRST
jgi:pimeloyl-ACP methyl ester carboxylesterase